MSWLLPDIVLPASDCIRTVGEPNEVQLEDARLARAKGRCRRWYYSAKGQAYRSSRRDRLNAYARERYRNTPALKAYVAKKKREYRADPFKRERMNERRRELRAAKKCATT